MSYVIKSTKYILFIILCAFALSINVKALADDEIVYKLFTDASGVRWQYAYNDDAQGADDVATESWVEIAFFDKQDTTTKVVVPSLDELKASDPELPSNVETLKLIDYIDEDLGEPVESTTDITEISLESVDQIDGVKPMINEEIQTKVIFSKTNNSVIGKNAFKGYKLDLVNLDFITEIGDNAFKGASLKNVNVSFDKLQKIGDGAFWGTNLMEVRINVENIHYNAFRECTDLTIVRLGNNVVKINDAAFYGDESLTLINFDNVTYIGNFAFRDCTAFNIDISDTKLTYIGDGAFYYTTGYTQDIVIPDGVNRIGYATFYKSSIPSVNLKNVTSVGPMAFMECPNLTDVDFGKVETIEYRAFMGDKNITTVDFTDSVIDIQTEAFNNCAIKDLNLNKVQKINYYAFANNNLTELVLPKSISVLDESNMFENNPLTNVTIEYDTLTNRSGNLFRVVMGEHTYKGITDLTLVAPYSDDEEAIVQSNFGTQRIPDGGIHYNRDNNFGKESSYKNIIKNNYFYGMTGLVNVTIGEGYEFIGAQAFLTDNIYASTDYYKLAKVQLPSTLKGIGSMAFAYNLVNDVDLKLPTNLDYIGYQAFFKCPGFKDKLDIPSLRMIGSKAFESSGVGNVYFHDKLEFIGEQVIFDAPNVKEIIFDVDYYALPNAGDYYGYSTGIDLEQQNFFRHMDNHQEYDLIKFTDKVVTEPCNGLEKRGMPMDGFMYNVKAKEIDMEETSWKSIGKDMFLKAQIGNLKLPKNVEYINYTAFYDTNITDELYLPNTIKIIDANAFNNAKLKISQLPENIEVIGYAAFFNSDFHSNPVVPKSVKSIGTSAFGALPNSGIVRDTFTFDCNLPVSVTQGNTIHGLTYYTDVKNLILTENVKELPTNQFNDSEFYGMALETAKIDGVNILPQKAFQDNLNLRYVDFSKDKDLSEIKDHAFYNDEKLSKVKFAGDKNQNILVGYSAFRNNGYEKIGDNEDDGFNLLDANFTFADTFIFADNSKLKEVYIPNDVSNNVIPAFTFTRCANLEKVTLAENVQRIGAYAFAEDVNLAKMFIWGDTKIDRVNQVTPINKANNIIVTDRTNGLKYDFAITNNGNEVASMSVNPSTRALNTLEYAYDGNGEIAFEYPDTVIIDVLETTNGYEVSVRAADPANFTIPSTTDIYAYSKTDANEYVKDYQRYRQSKELDTDSDILYFDEVIYLTSNHPTVKVNDTKDNFDKSKLTVYALRRDGIVMESTKWGEYGSQYKLAQLPSSIIFEEYDESNLDKYGVVYNTPFEASKADSSTENFANMTFDIVQSENGVKHIDLYYTNSIIDTEVSTPVKPKSNIANVNTLDNIFKYTGIFAFSLIAIIMCLLFYKRSRKA